MQEEEGCEEKVVRVIHLSRLEVGMIRIGDGMVWLLSDRLACFDLRKAMTGQGLGYVLEGLC